MASLGDYYGGADPGLRSATYLDPAEMLGMTPGDLQRTMGEQVENARFQQMMRVADPAQADVMAAQYAGMTGGDRQYLSDKLQMIAQPMMAARQQQSTALMEATKRLDYLTQFMSPDKAVAEVARKTGVDLGGRVDSTPNLLKRRSDEADIASKIEATEKTKAETMTARVKAEQERQGFIDEPAASRDKVDQTIEALERVREAAASIRTSGNIEWGTGIAGAAGRKLNELTGMETPAATLKTQLDTLKGQVALQAMAQLKALSAAGSTGFGALSAPELALLENSIVNLQSAQGERGIKQSLMQLEREMENARVKAELRYRQHYGDRAVQSVAPPRPFPSNRAAARPGTTYDTPRGPMTWTGTGFLPIQGATTKAGTSGSW